MHPRPRTTTAHYPSASHSEHGEGLARIMKSYMDLIDAADRFPYGDANEADLAKHGLYVLLWEDTQGRYPIGYVLDRVVDELWRVPDGVRGAMDLNRTKRTLLLFQLPTEAERSRAAAALARHWRESGTFKLLRGWRDELLPIYGRHGELLLSIERAALGLLGTMRYGVHLTAYVVDATAPHGLKLWVPRRAANKCTFPGMLDNTVAGGLVTGENARECIVREADEEASLPVDVVRQQARCVGTITYIYVTDEDQGGEGGLVYPECQWIYDLELPATVTPQPKDGEVDHFSLCDVEQVQRDLLSGKFKYNCALVLIDFLIRHRVLAFSESELAAIRRRMHRRLPFPGPHRSWWGGSEPRDRGEFAESLAGASVEAKGGGWEL